MNYSVAVVDDQLLFANVLEKLINTFDNFHVLYHVKSGDEFVEKLKETKNIPDIALVDINMPGMNGIDTMKWLRIHHPAVKVLALTMDDDEETIVTMLKSGAKSYLFKDINPTILHDSLKEVVEKGFYYPDKITNILLSSLHKGGAPQIVLKDREIEFLKQICTEKTYKEIASEMFLSPKTIDGYREALFEKLNKKSRVGLAIYAIKNKFYKVD
jgi:DNA-binding NarL/FixJ family response regulator